MTAPAATNRAVTRLNLADPAQVFAYESAFYASFASATHNRLIHWLWDWDHDTRRLRTKLGYDVQAVYAMRDPAGAIDAAIGVNLRPPPLQAAAFGFALPAHLPPERTVEFLTLFAPGEHSLTRKLILWREVFEDLLHAGYTDAVATTAAKVLPLYLYMGATRLAEAAPEGEARYFLHFDLSTVPGQRRSRRITPGATATP